MDHTKWTPTKDKMSCESIMILSPITKTPIRKNDVKLKSTFQNCTNSFSMLPTHITPPSGLTKFIARNPFDADLTSKLHISVISPSVFSKVSSPSQKRSPGFSWSIDEIALMQPAKIDEFPVQQMHCSDPEVEKNAQEAISRFFNENQIIPSPFEVKRNKTEIPLGLKTPVRISEEENISRDSNKLKKEKRDSWTQTILSLPPELPANVEEVLRPYFNFNQDQNCESDEANSSNNSLRRKLFSNHDDSHDESQSSILISPVKPSSPLIHNLSPPQSGMFFHGTPLRNCSQIIQRTYGTPLTSNRSSSPFDVSPISNTNFNMSCQSIKSRKSVTRLDFTKEMSIEVLEEEKESRKSPIINANICKTLFLDKTEVNRINVGQIQAEKLGHCDTTQMTISTDNWKMFKNEEKENFISHNFNTIEKSRIMEIGKTNFNESYAMQQSNMLSGNYAQQTMFSSTQDTGYQTYSSSSITGNMDSCSTSIKQKLHWDERVVQTEEEVQLSDWRDNIKSVISSTPSKFNKGLNMV